MSNLLHLTRVNSDNVECILGSFAQTTEEERAVKNLRGLSLYMHYHILDSSYHASLRHMVISGVPFLIQSFFPNLRNPSITPSFGLYSVILNKICA